MAGEEFDINKFAAEFVNKRIDSFFTSVKGVIKGIAEDFKIIQKQHYTAYLVAVATKYGKTRSFFIRDEPTLLYKWYVPTGLSCGGIKIKEANFSDVLRIARFAVIVGAGGCGKSILLKHFLLNSIKDNKFVPVFVEMRELNNRDTSLMELILESINQFGLSMDESLFDKALTAGHFAFLFDGFDEVSSRKRNKIASEIQQLSKKYGDNSIIVTTRPDERISELSDFYVFETLPLSKEQSIQLVEKLPAEEEIKAKFIRDLKTGLYKKHASFLSNPLLLSIMLLTYGYSADIPNKLSIFYNQAYEAMFQRHDAYKGAFRRIRETELDIQDFGTVCSAFCIQSYDERRVRFSQNQALLYLKKAKAITTFSYRSEDFLDDLKQSICMLVEDGLFLNFAHRSLQEYFAARFIVNSDLETKKRLLNRYKSYVQEDSVYKLVHELDPSFMECEIILPFLNELFAEIGLKKRITTKSFMAFTKVMWSEYLFRDGQLWGTIGDGIKNALLLFTLENLHYLIDGDSGFNVRYGGIAAKCIAETKSGGKPIRYKTRDLKESSPILKEVSESQGLLSSVSLERLISIQRAIIAKKKQSSETLEKIIFKKT